MQRSDIGRMSLKGKGKRESVDAFEIIKAEASMTITNIDSHARREALHGVRREFSPS